MKAFLISVRDKDSLTIELSFDEKFREDKKYKKCEVKQGEVAILSNRLSFTESNGEIQITHSTRDVHKNRVQKKLTLAEALLLERSELRFSTSVVVAFEFEIDKTTGEITKFGLPTNIKTLTHLKMFYNSKGNIRVKIIEAFSKTDDLYVKNENLLYEYVQTDLNFMIYLPEKDVIARKNFLDIMSFRKTGITRSYDGIASEYSFMGIPMAQPLWYRRTEKSYTAGPREALLDNVRKHIQYNHILTNGISYSGLTSIIFEACIDASDNKFATFCNRLNTIEGCTILEEKPTRMVPKNGEKRALDRAMSFRTDMANALIAIGATRLYSVINVDSRNLGTRIVDDKLIPYIHTYNLYTTDCEKLSTKYQYCAYLDISDFFNRVTYTLVEDAVIALVGAKQLAGVKQALSAIRKAMTCNGKNYLTIDSNFEHAIATVVMSFLLKNLQVAYRTFVDDTLLFSNSSEELEHAINTLNDTLKVYNLEINESKTKRFDSDYTVELKQLVFLPTGLRYRTDAIFADIRLIGFQDFLTHNVLPEVNAFSSAESMRKVFYYKEAEWVVDNYKQLCTTDYRKIEVTEENILEILQHYTIRQAPLTGEDICRLIVIGEEFPSKWKWVISVLREADSTVANILKYHHSEYVRYLVNGSNFLKAAHEIYKPVFQSVVVSNQKELDHVIAVLGFSRQLRGFFLDFEESLQTVDARNHLTVSYNNKEYQLLESPKLSATLKDGKFQPESYPYALWNMLVRHDLNIYCEGAIV